METKLRRLLDALPAMVWTASPDGTRDFVNKHWLDYSGLTLEEALAADWTAIFHQDDLAVALAAWELTLAAPPRDIEVEARLRRFDGVYRRFKIQTRPLQDAQGQLIGWCGISTDVEDRKRAEAQLAAEKQLLEQVARGVDLPKILGELCLQVESLSQGSLCSILYVDSDRRHFRVGAGPNLPEAYNAALDGLKIDPGYGPCSLAVETRSTIIAADPPRDPRFEGSAWPALIAEFGLASCWSAPIFGNNRDVLGIFAIYKLEPRGPSEDDTELIDRFVQIAGIAIERSQADAALNSKAMELRRAHDHLAQAQRLSKTGSFTTDVEADTHVWSDELYRILEFAPGTAVSFKTFRSLIHPDDQQAFSHGFHAAVKDRKDFDAVFRLVTPNGALKYLHAVAHHVADSSRAIVMGSIQDVTEGKVAEEALRAGKEELRRVNRYLATGERLSKTGSFRWEIATDDQQWSDELYRIWEMPRDGDRRVGTLHNSVVHPDDLPGLKAIVTPAMAAGTGYEISYRIVTPSGAIKHLHTVNERVAEITDRLVYMGATQDLTAYRLAEEALKASEAQLRKANRYLKGAQTLSRIGSFTWDVEADAQDWSDENFRIWEFDACVTPTMSMVLEAIHPDDLAAAGQAIAEGRRTGEDFEISYRIVTRSGTVKHLHTIATRVAEVVDRLVYIGSTQDVTASKLAEADLARANTYLVAAQSLSQTGSFTWDVAADEHNWSDVIYKVFGFEPGTKITMGMMMQAIHPEDVPLVETLIGGAAVGENFELVFRVITPTGDLRYAHVMGHRIDQIPDRPVFMGALQDITARKLAEDDLSRTREELAHVSRVMALSTLTASIAHEVSQPLAGIITNSSACLRMLAADPPDVAGAQATVQRTLRDGNRASEVIKRLRALYGRKPLSLESVDLQEVAREMLALLASELQRRRVRVRAELAAPLPLVTADRIQLQQVILNLILNAADAMVDVVDRARELRVSAHVEADGLVTLEVRDSGVGLEPDRIDPLFKAFHTTKADGMGIGLSVSRSIIEAHGGRLTARPNLEAPGATFSFSIPHDGSPAVADQVLRQV
ncbi:PAS domain-containing protein [Caulobacter sp.]|uniref:PAS domain-containing protein n=1 Tax=Caulobacter sp. TaxID=78 RepID=UPI003BAF54BE